MIIRCPLALGGQQLSIRRVSAAGSTRCAGICPQSLPPAAVYGSAGAGLGRAGGHRPVWGRKHGKRERQHARHQAAAWRFWDSTPKIWAVPGRTGTRPSSCDSCVPAATSCAGCGQEPCRAPLAVTRRGRARTWAGVWQDPARWHRRAQLRRRASRAPEPGSASHPLAAALPPPSCHSVT